MEIWTTFAPSKICWELTYVKTKGKFAINDWLKHIQLINNSLAILKSANISGIRLVIYPSELTTDGKNFNLKPIDRMLGLCKKHKILVDLCVGPFQFPYYPGIYFPKHILDLVFDFPRCVDTTDEIWRYGMNFLKTLMSSYGADKRVNGFHLANEWPDGQHISGKEKIKSSVSLAFMLSAADLVNKNTEKQISLNTNIHINNKRKIKNTFKEILKVLGDKGNLGFDVYPSQNRWKNNSLQKLSELVFSSQKSFRSIRKVFPNTSLYFAEVEAQPWGGGQSWRQLITESETPHEKVLKYYINSLNETWRKCIKGTSVKVVSLWGSDFWLSADAMGIKWPLENVKNLKMLF